MKNLQLKEDAYSFITERHNEIAVYLERNFHPHRQLCEKIHESINHCEENLQPAEWKIVKEAFNMLLLRVATEGMFFYMQGLKEANFIENYYGEHFLEEYYSHHLTGMPDYLI